MLEVILYTKDECPLCDHVKADLAMLAATFPHSLREVDITEERDLYLKFRYLIPVVMVGEQRLQAPISAVQLAAALRRASR